MPEMLQIALLGGLFTAVGASIAGKFRRPQHGLRQVCAPQVFGVTMWVCHCGARHPSHEGHARHMAVTS